MEDHEIYRQSPHDPADHTVDIVKQPVSMIAHQDGSGYAIAISDAPAFYENYTTQTFNPQKREALLSSGDNGKIPGTKPTRSKIESFY